MCNAGQLPPDRLVLSKVDMYKSSLQYNLAQKPLSSMTTEGKMQHDHTRSKTHSAGHCHCADDSRLNLGPDHCHCQCTAYVCTHKDTGAKNIASPLCEHEKLGVSFSCGALCVEEHHIAGACSELT